VRVAIADDSALFREGLTRLLEEAGHYVVGAVADASALLDVVEREVPDIAVADIRMPPTQSDEGLVAAVAIRERNPDVGVVVLSNYLETHHAVQLLTAGSGRVGYLLKDHVADVREFLDALRRVADGGVVIDPDVIAQLFGRSRAPDPLDDLSDRERQVLALIAEGHSNRAICEILVLSKRTVESHVASIFKKLGLRENLAGDRRVLAVLTYLRS
jgi:DNA-binding NarL/FixJ family response regulator